MAFKKKTFPAHYRLFASKEVLKKKDSSEAIRQEICLPRSGPDELTQAGPEIPPCPPGFPIVEDPSISVIVPVFNQWTFTVRCLNSVREHSDPDIPYEIIVADDSSTDETPGMLKQIAGIKIIRQAKNVGFLRNCNNAARSARGTYIIFVNNDTLVTRGWMRSLFDTAERDKAVGLVGAKLLYPDGKLQEAGGIVFRDLNVSAKRFGWQRDPEGYEFNYVKEVDYCSGACILVRKDIFNRLNGFDEQFAPAYYEDTDLAFSVRNLGYKVVYQPDAEVIHFESKSHSNEASEEKQNLMNAHKLKFHKKWHRVLLTEHDKDRKDLFLSRDRSHHKKILLYIDRHVPTWDQDAGSLVAYDYLKVLSGLGTKVIFWPDDLRKIDPYTKKLQQMGMEIVYGDEDFKEYIEKYGNYIHAAILSRPAPSIKYIDDIRRHTTATIFYICHDLHFLRLQRKMTLEKDETLMKEIDQMKKAEMYLMRHSDLTIVFNRVEEELIRQTDHTIKVEVFPFVATKQERGNTFEERRDLIFIGNFLHGPNEDAVLWFHDEIFPLIKKRLSGIQLIIVGSNPTARILGLHSADTIVTGYVPDVSQYFLKGKVFIAPLRYGAGLKGKIIQAMSYGLPVVTTSIGAEGADMVDNDTVLLADDAESFAEKVSALYCDKTLWQKISDNSLLFIANHHTEELVRKRFASILL
jgi:GT2 family glycosyltransferase